MCVLCVVTHIVERMRQKILNFEWNVATDEESGFAFVCTFCISKYAHTHISLSKHQFCYIRYNFFGREFGGQTRILNFYVLYFFLQGKRCGVSVFCACLLLFFFVCAFVPK